MSYIESMNLPSEDISVTGTLRSYLSLGYSNRNCIGEAIDNVKDTGASDIKLFLFEDVQSTTKKYYFVTSGNGNGMTVKQLSEAQQLQQWKHASNKQGRFGYGYGVLRSVLSRNYGIVRWLSCHNDLTQDEINDPYHSGKFAQIEINMTDSVLQNRLIKTTSDEISRKNEVYWTKFAVNQYKTGTVLMIEMTEQKFYELKFDFTNPEPDKNIVLNCSRDYARIIESGINIHYTIDGNEKIIKSLPKPAKSYTLKKKMDIWECQPLEDDLFVQNCTYKVSTMVTIDQEDDNILIYYKQHNRRRTKIIMPSSVSLVRKIATLESIFIRDILRYFEDNNKFFEDIGIAVKNSNNVSQDLQGMIITDMVCRNEKMIVIDTDIEKISGDKDKISCRNDVLNIFHLNYQEYSEQHRFDIINMIDDSFGINVNKGMVHSRSLSTDISLMRGAIKSLVNKKYFYNKIQSIQEDREQDTTIQNCENRGVRGDRDVEDTDEIEQPNNCIIQNKLNFSVRQASRVSQGHDKAVVIANIVSIKKLDLSDDAKYEAVYGAEKIIGLRHILKDRIKYLFGAQSNFILNIPYYKNANSMNFDDYINEIERYIQYSYDNTNERSIGSGTHISKLLTYLQKK